MNWGIVHFQTYRTNNFQFPPNWDFRMLQVCTPWYSLGWRSHFADDFFEILRGCIYVCIYIYIHMYLYTYMHRT
jgi:hypothetical protein